jgi:hypothetical protein
MKVRLGKHIDKEQQKKKHYCPGSPFFFFPYWVCSPQEAKACGYSVRAGTKADKK